MSQATVEPEYFPPETSPAPEFIPSPTAEKFMYAVSHGDYNEIRLLILSSPRGEGKCQPAGSSLLCADGRLVEIQHVHHDAVLAVDHELNLKTAYAERAQAFPAEPCLTVRTATGYEVTGNLAHPLRTLAGWTPMGQLRVGDHLGTLRTCPATGTDPLPEGIAAFAGYMVGDGNCESVVFSGRDPASRARLAEIAALHTWRVVPTGVDIRLAGRHTTETERWCAWQGHWTDRMSYGRSVYCQPCFAEYERLRRAGRHRERPSSTRPRAPIGWIRRLGLYGIKSPAKRVPPEIFTAPNTDVAAFLGAYFECDGTVADPAKRVQAEYYSVSRGLLQDVKHLLLRFGVVSVLLKKHGRYQGQRHVSWRLKINGSFLRRFAEAIPVLGVKGDRLRVAAARVQADNANLDIVPHGWERLLHRGENWHRLRGVRWGHDNRHGHGRAVVERVARSEGNAELLALATSAIYWDRIVAVESAGAHPVFGVEVPGPAPYVTDGGVLSHNTTTGIYACMELAARVQRERGDAANLPLRVACVRDTFENLQRTTLISFDEQRQKGLPVEFMDGRKQAMIAYDRPLVHFFFFGLDRPEDADKLQGFSCAVLWIEEAAPAAGLASGVSSAVLGIGGTSLRQDGIPPRILITMNPPDDDHWTLEVEKHLAEADLPEIRVARFDIPQGEKSRHFETLAQETNDHLAAAQWTEAARAFDRYRKANRALLESIHRHDLVARLVEGRTGDIQIGEAVMPYFSRKKHIATEPILVYPQLQLWRFWDGGGTPSCVWAQPLPPNNTGGINIIGSRVAMNAGLEGFILNDVLTFQQRYGLMPRSPGTKAGGFSSR